ncbi:hypothetical protein EST38_g7032 [Candolleomyces aberdarensis]|uniref:Uncharacterized protein n=1 Tax=Candolleomyces aberdarensis TaxID=2316362 RepID=A0A4Q2DIA9_9AGAR|nr:hypothetical protein EST38_g7032 [Candolleomyces aberdarensis]
MESPFSTRFGTNYAPTAAELGEIRCLLDKPIPDLAGLDEDIRRVTLELSVLNAKRDAYKLYMANHNALLAPIRRIPVDILYAIFLLCLPTKHNATMSPAQAPLLLTHVCKQWRELALNMPLLWASIHVPIPSCPGKASCLPGPPILFRGEQPLTHEQKAIFDAKMRHWDYKIDQRKKVVEEWLKRAGTSPLSISFIQWDPRNNPPGMELQLGDSDTSKRKEVKEIVSLIRSYSRQWERLEISAAKDIVAELLSVPAEEAPIIQSLRTCTQPKLRQQPGWGLLGPIVSVDPTPEPLFTESSFITAPSLRFISLPLLQQDLSKIPARWTNLTSFFFYGYSDYLQDDPHSSLSFTPSHALDLLAACPNLRRCGLAFGPAPRWQPGMMNEPSAVADPKEIRHVSMPFLEKLWVQEQKKYPLTNFFKSLELPSLSSLSFSTSAIPNPRMESSLVTLLESWGYGLKKLALDYSHMSQRDLRECLRLARYVEKLVLNMDQEKTAYRMGMSWTPTFYSEMERDEQLRPAYLGNKFMEELTPKIVEVNEPAPEAEGCGGFGQAETGEIEGRDCGLTLDSPSLCSNLTSLTARLVTAEFNEETLLDFIRSRRHKLGKDLGIAPLRKLKVHFAIRKPREEREPEKNTADKARLTNKKHEWAMLKNLEDDPHVDVEGMDVEVSWPHEHTSRSRKTLRRLQEGIWSPTAGLPCKCA